VQEKNTAKRQCKSNYSSSSFEQLPDLLLADGYVWKNLVVTPVVVFLNVKLSQINSNLIGRVHSYADVIAGAVQQCSNI
jgi:hypothetical protein